MVAADFVKDNEHKVAFTTAGYTTGRTYKAFTKDHTPGTDVYLLVSISMEGYKDAEVVSSPAVVDEHNISEATFRVTKYDNTVDGATKADYERKNNDVVLEIKHTLYEEQLDDYTYTVYEARPIIKTTMTSETIVWDFDTVDWTIGEVNEKFQAAGFKKNAYENTAASEYVSFVELENLTPGDYAWKLVVANKDTGKVKNTFVRHIQIDGVESKFIEFVPEEI